MLKHTLEIDRITKVYGRTAANREMSLELHAGEVHGLLGQNGAGKSTLVGVLTGHVRPDSGLVRADGVELDLSTGDRALNAGIVAVYQTPLLVPSMTGLENVALALNQAPTRQIGDRLRKLGERFGLALSLDVAVERLDMAARLRIEFARALCQEPSVLLLDEPTTFLPPTEVDEFLATVRRLADSGVAVMMITHRLDEARRVCDRLTIIRAGEVIAEYPRDLFPESHELAVAMLGESVEEPAHTGAPGTEVVLSVAGLSTPSGAHSDIAVADVHLDVHAGELVGIAGVDGNGQTQLLEAIAGARRMTGSVTLAGRNLSRSSYAERFRAGLQLVSGDRRRHGIVPELSVYEHFDFALPDQRREQVLEALAHYDTRPLDLDIRADALSGGNQQKVILARGLRADPRVLMLAYPTQGLDVSATARIHGALLERARAGLGLIVISSDLDELLALCDRVIVMYRGRMVGSQLRGEIDRRALARWFTGITEREEPRVGVQ